MKPSLLMVAYACDPDGIGEYWLGWGWAEEASKHYNLHLITTPKGRKGVERESERCGFQAHFVDLSSRMTRWAGLLRRGGDYLPMILWQRRVLEVADNLHRRERFALVHQTTFHSFRVPFQASRLGIPSVWGPIAGGESVPKGFGRFLGSARTSERLRQIVNRPWLEIPSVAASLRRADVLLVSNRVTRDFLPSQFRDKTFVVPPNVMRREDIEFDARFEEKDPAEKLSLLYAGWCVHTRSIPMVLEAIARCGLKNYSLTVIGEGPALDYWRAEAMRWGVAKNVSFTGKLPYAVVKEHYRSADVLVFPALRDSGGSALLEGMARGVPVLSLDWGGPGEMVDDQSGIKIPVNDPDETVRLFGEALLRLQKDPKLRVSLAKAARKRAETLFSWPAKLELVEPHYRRLMARSQ
jgi:glycosyltransferase involved in cell wall biosynthesis